MQEARSYLVSEGFEIPSAEVVFSQLALKHRPHSSPLLLRLQCVQTPHRPRRPSLLQILPRPIPGRVQHTDLFNLRGMSLMAYLVCLCRVIWVVV